MPIMYILRTMINGNAHTMMHGFGGVVFGVVYVVAGVVIGGGTGERCCYSVAVFISTRRHHLVYMLQ